jgi:lipoate-protein ligase A
MLFEEIIEIVDSEPHEAALNMAIDETLLQAAAMPILRVYQWIRPSLSFGYFARFESVKEAWPDRDLVRRWTGGGVVPHGEDMTYTLIVPSKAPFFCRSARESYRLIHEEIAAYLNGLGRAVGVAAESRGKVSEACFENPVAFDLLAGGMKIAGAAQRRTRCGLLHQGSIRIPGVEPGFSEGLAGVLAAKTARRGLSASEVENARQLMAQKYATESWLRRF